MGDLDHRLLLAQDYALINPLQVESALWRDLPVMPLIPKGIDAQPHLMPRLLELRSMAENVRIELLDRAALQHRRSRRPYFSALLASDRPAEQLALQLAKRLIVRGPNRREALFRYYDPRVFRHLRWLLTEEQMTVLLRPVSIWTWRDAHGHWRQRHRAETPRLSNLRVTPEQWGSLQRLGLLNQSLRQIERNAPDLAQDDTIAERADHLLQAAYARHGLTDRADRCLYAEQGIRFHLDIHRHAEVAARLARVRDGATSYVGACTDLDDAALRKFADDLAPTTRMSQ